MTTCRPEARAVLPEAPALLFEAPCAREAIASSVLALAGRHLLRPGCRKIEKCRPMISWRSTGSSVARAGVPGRGWPTVQIQHEDAVVHDALDEQPGSGPRSRSRGVTAWPSFLPSWLSADGSPAGQRVSRWGSAHAAPSSAGGSDVAGDAVTVELSHGRGPGRSSGRSSLGHEVRTGRSSDTLDRALR